jgi:NTP pyrophosphatase (non-canonical NTP hydrolase)
MNPEIFNLIRSWAEDRNIIKGSSIKSQYIKLVEEVGEMAKNINKNKNIEDDIGDIVVVLTILAKMHNTTIEDCIDLAYNEIKTRKGKMINGTFIKEKDLPNYQ